MLKLNFRGDFRAPTLRLVLLLVISAFACPLLLTQTSTVSNLQVGHDFWGFKEGAPGDVFALAQTSDGFLWLGTATGLFRFDGTRFERFHSPFGDQLLSTNIYALFAPPTGGLWIGYAFGSFSFLKNGKVTNYGGESAPATGSVGNFAQDKDGIVWAATINGLWRFDHSRWQQVGPELGLSPGPILDVRLDRVGTLWALSGSGDSSAQTPLVYLRMGSRQFQMARSHLFFPGFTRDADGYVATSPEGQHLLDNLGTDAVDHPVAYPLLRKGCTAIVDRTGSIWIIPPEPILLRSPPSGQPLSDVLAKASRSNSETYELPAIYAKLVDREGNIWFGEQKGLHRFFYSPLTKQALPKSAEGSGLFTVTPDEDGAVWINAGNGQLANMYFIGHAQVKARKAPGPLAGFAYRAPDKTSWFGGQAGLWHLVKGNLIRVDLPKEKADEAYFLQGITQDRNGGMWVSFGGHGLYRLADGVWTPYGGRDDIPKLPVTTEFTDSLGRVWFGYTKNKLAVLDGDRVKAFGPSDGLRMGNVTAIYGLGSEIWIGGELGLQQFDHGQFHDIRTTNEEWLRGISGIVEAANGDLWLNGLGGIFHVSRPELSQALKNHGYYVKGDHFGRREGLPGFANQLRPLNTAVEGTDGRLWFATSNGVVWLDPTRSDKKVSPPPPTIESVSADDKNYPLGTDLKFPARTSNVQISYAAVSLSDPEAIHFRYKLQETDKDWHEVETASPMSYRNLAPGSYHFTVSATDTNGVWSDKVPTVEFTVLPAFRQTRWFLFLCIITAAALLYLFFLLRVRQVARQVRGRVEARLAERERIARDLHDTLLQSVQGLILKIHAATKRIPDGEPARQEMERALDYADQVLMEGRDRVRNLRSTDPLIRDLPAAFRQIADLTSHDRKMIIQTVVEGTPRELHSLVLEEVFAIGREALLNAFSHSAGQHVEVEITYDARQFRLRVSDDGRGIDSTILEKGGRDNHWGLNGMRERASKIGGRLELWSRPGNGTKAELTVPAGTAYRAEPRFKKFSLRRSSGAVD